MGRRAEALAPAQEAAGLCRQLAERNPDAFTPYLAGSLSNLALRLSELGRQTEALAPAQEALDIRRQLAERNPDAFRPDLAMSLGVMANVLEGNDRREEAWASFAEGVRVLTPSFIGLPAAFAPLMGGLVHDYMRLAMSLEREPDMELLAPVLPVLQELEGQQPAP